MVVNTSSQTLLLIKDPDNLENRLKEIPPQPGVYLMSDQNGNILYIGKSKKLRTRVRSYFRESPKHSDLPKAAPQRGERIALMVSQVSAIEFIVTDTEAEALALEANLVKQHQPYFNVLLKDDKRYPYVCITWSEEYPRIFITRKRKLGKEKDRYYGPYVDSGLLRYTLHLIKSLFPLRQRPRPLFKDRPCLNYDLGRCPGVCQNLITPEEYRQTVQKVAMIFQGRIGELVETLTSNMEQAASNLNFEQAGKIRDQIKALQGLQVAQKVSLPDDTVSRDAIALVADEQHCSIQIFQIRAGQLVGRLGYFAENKIATPGEILQKVLEEHYMEREAVEIPSEILVQHPLPEGEILAEVLTQRKGRKVNIIVPLRQTKAELIEMVERNAEYELARTQKEEDKNQQALEDLAEILELSQLPKRIEGYDISHILGSNAVASRVVFIHGVPAKQHYRHYKIKNPTVTIGHSDDFASMAEVIRRRFSKTLSQDKPDLVMIDGGKGQLNAVLSVLEEMDLTDQFKVVSLAKQREEIFIPGESEPLATDPEQAGVQLLRRVRDEAHRFAVSFHRQQRWNQTVRSHLDDIPGLGHYRQKQLLGHFHSVEYIRQASVEQLAEVPGIGKATAQQIYDYFHG